MFTMHIIVICSISGNYVLGLVWAVHIEFKKQTKNCWKIDNTDDIKHKISI